MTALDLPPGFAVTAPPLRPPVVFDQRWEDLAFVHWPVEPQSVAHFFPPGTRPDVFADGWTYVALVPFAMRGAGFGTVGAVPYFGSFLETNIRLYSVDEEGRHGVLFRSLDASRFAIMPFARAVFGMNYTWSRMRLRRQGATIDYSLVRRMPQRGLRSRVTLRIGERIEPTPLEIFLTARWGAHTSLFGRTVWVPNEHGAWPLHEAEVVELDDELLGASGVVPAGERLRVLWSPGVRTQFGLPSRVRSARRRPAYRFSVAVPSVLSRSRSRTVMRPQGRSG